MKMCDRCGNEYMPRQKQPAQRWCSRKCGRDARNANRTVVLHERLRTGKCQECGASLEGRRSDAKWCSESCSTKTEARKAVQRRAKLKKAYGLTEAEHEAMFASQGRCCAICRSPDPRHPRGTWSVDHDHVSGVVRGLLCTRCNTGIGHLRDDPTILRAAADYLEACPLGSVPS